MTKLAELKRTIIMLEEDNKLLSKIKDEEDAIEAERDVLRNRVVELEKKLTASESAKESYRTSSNGYNQELNQLHEVLDALPGSIPKRAEESYQDRSVLTRLAAWLGSTK